MICFTGMREGIPDDVGADNCVEGFKQIVGHAEKKGVTLCLEMLNSRVSTHPMKGHPGYQGDHTDYCIDIIKRVGSPNLKLLFDIYHVQIMDGDVISRIRQHRDYIAHVHTAGNPGRGELDDKQEINYPPIMEALLEIGYQGHVGQEFIPTRDPSRGCGRPSRCATFETLGGPGDAKRRSNHTTPPQALTSFPACFWILRTASAIWSMSDRGPRNMVWMSQTPCSQSRSFAGQWIRSK